MSALPSFTPVSGTNVIVTGAVGGVGSALMAALEHLKCSAIGIDLPKVVQSAPDRGRLIAADLSDRRTRGDRAKFNSAIAWLRNYAGTGVGQPPFGKGRRGIGNLNSSAPRDYPLTVTEVAGGLSSLRWRGPALESSQRRYREAMLGRPARGQHVPRPCRPGGRADAVTATHLSSDTGPLSALLSGTVAESQRAIAVTTCVQRRW